MDENVLVTGCAGFIGSNLVKRFKYRFPKLNIIGIDNFSTGRRSLLDKDITFYEGSILDSKLLEKVFKKYKPKFIFHLAALPRVSYSIEHPYDSAEVNILGTIKLLEYSVKYRTMRFINSSSSSVYGNLKKIPTKESDITGNFTSPYALEKYSSERFCKIFNDIYGLDTVSLRYFSVFGPGQYGDNPYSTVISAWLESLFNPNKKAFLEGDGSQSRDFCYIDNVIEANILSMTNKSKLNGIAINIAEGKRRTLLNVIKKIEQLTNKKLNLETRPERVGDIRNSLADLKLAKKTIGYKPKSDFEAQLLTTINWFSDRG